MRWRHAQATQVANSICIPRKSHTTIVLTVTDSGRGPSCARLVAARDFGLPRVGRSMATPWEARLFYRGNHDPHTTLTAKFPWWPNHDPGVARDDHAVVRTGFRCCCKIASRFTP